MLSNFFNESAMNKHKKVHHFVSSFLGKDFIDETCSRAEIIHYLNQYVRKNFKLLENDNKSFKVLNKLKYFFNDCKFVAKKRGEYIIIPEVMKYSEVMSYLKYCFVIDIDDGAELIYQKEYQKKFIETINNEFFSIILHPDNIPYFIHLGIEFSHLGTGIDFIPYSESSEFKIEDIE